MFKCPVCHHATLNWYEYTLKSGFATVECSNCHTELHQPRRLRSMVSVSPMLLMPLAQHMRWVTTERADWSLLVVCSAAVLWLATRMTKLEAVAPAER